MSRANILNPCGPTTIPATIIPITWGILRRLSSIGASRIIASTIRKIDTGDETIGLMAGMASDNIMTLCVRLA